MIRTSIVAGAIAVALAAPGLAFAQGQMAPIAQTGGIKRIPLQRFDVPPGVREVVTAIAEIAPNGEIARHIHPGPEVDYILDGQVDLKVGDDPSKTYKAGDSIYIPQATPHGGRAGPSGAKVLATYIVEKGKPLATPAP